jgi:hypothetical protein
VDFLLFHGSLMSAHTVQRGIIMEIALNQANTAVAQNRLRARVNGWLLALALGASITLAGIGAALPHQASVQSGAVTTHQIASETGGPMG